MVIALVILTILIFILIDYFTRREDRKIKTRDRTARSPIFLTPDKALIRVDADETRLNHLSHTWVQPTENGAAFVGFDDFISFLLPGTVQLSSLPNIDQHVSQGEKIWELKINGRRIPQMSPVSGNVVAINPACTMDIALPTREVEKSWVVKICPTQYPYESRNLTPMDLAVTMNRSLHDEVVLMAHDGHFLNDGGELEADFLRALPEESWS